MHKGITWLTVRLITAAIVIQAAHGEDLSQGQLFQETGKSTTALAFSKDRRLLAGGSSDGVVNIWEFHPRRLLRTSFVHRGKVAALAFSPDNRLLASGGQDRFVRVWTVEGREFRNLEAHTNGISALAFSPDGKTFASGSDDGALCLWNAQSWVLAKRLPSHPSCIHALLISANNEFLASGSDDFLRIWNLKDPKYSYDTLHASVRALYYDDLNVASPGDQKPKFESSDGRSIMGWQPSGVIGTHILTPWRDHIGIEWPESQAKPFVVAAEGDLMATGGTNGVVEIWDANGYGNVKLAAHRAAVVSMAFSPDGALLATGGEDGTIKLWRARELMDLADTEAKKKWDEKNRQR